MQKINYYMILIILLLNNSLQCYPQIATTINYSVNYNNEGYIYENSFISMQTKLIKQYMNLSVDPCNDFYQYACGNWNSLNPIPSDQSELDIFSKSDNNIVNVLRNEFSNNQYTNEIESKAKLFFSTCIDIQTINYRSTQPLLNFIQELGGWPALNYIWFENNFNLINVLVQQQKYGHTSLFGVSTDINLYNNEIYAINVYQPNIDITNLSNENDYKEFIISILQLLKVPLDKANNVAMQIFEFEEKLLNLTNAADDLELLDYFMPTTIEELTIMYPIFNWQRYFNGIYNQQFNSRQLIILNGYPNLNEYMELLSSSSNEVIANYVIWRSVYSLIDLLDEKFSNAFQKLQKATSGKEKEKERWKKCVEITNKKLEWLSASMYIKATAIDEYAKYEITKLTEDIRSEFYKTLLSLNWIDEQTKYEAILKINNTFLSIGYPDFILDDRKLKSYYDDIYLENGKYFENYLAVEKSRKLKEHQHLSKYVDKTEWPVKPAEANAFFDQTSNRILVAVGLLQPPLYHRDYPQALKYGGITFFISHEVTHGFDSTGRQLDYKGNLRTWWTNQSIEEFNSRAECFVNQFDSFEIFGKHLSGKNSKAETIADSGGLRHAFILYRNWLNRATSEEKAKEKLPNLDLTEEKLFFLGYAQSWCSDIRPEAVEKKVLTDDHPPGKFRLLGSLQNFEEFSQTFNCPKGSYMNPQEKCKLW